MTRSPARRSGLVAVVLAVLVAACGSGGPTVTGPAPTDSAASGATMPEAGTPTVVPGLTAILEQYREDEILNLLQVKASNHSTSSVDVLDLRLDWAGITANDPLDRGVLVSPGQRVDIPINAGRAVCSDPPGADEQPPAGPAVAVGHASATRQ